MTKCERIVVACRRRFTDILPEVAPEEIRLRQPLLVTGLGIERQCISELVAGLRWVTQVRERVPCIRQRSCSRLARVLRKHRQQFVDDGERTLVVADIGEERRLDVQKVGACV